MNIFLLFFQIKNCKLLDLCKTNNTTSTANNTAEAFAKFSITATARRKKFETGESFFLKVLNLD